MSRTHARSSVIAAAVLAALAGAAGSAAAHVEVEADDARALAQNVTLNFAAESESASAGITKLQVTLPKGLVPGDVTYKGGPKGWKFTAGDDGYTVAGPAVPAGEDAEYAVTVRQLPDAKSLAFKTLQSYSDGRIDRWIELEESTGGHGHGSSAPTLTLRPAAPGAEPVSPSPSAEPTTPAPATPAPSPSATAETTPAAAADDKNAEEGGTSVALPIALALVVIALAGGAWWWFKRRSNTTST
ncbi:DUF1775 domain-containing protein [Streptomyces sp. NPDC048560]|uniref:DUF1775 domain-containing protein n=1 Tax=Streptomyces sp. NPDC048560 TaxID=3155488 RepID=UPI00341529A2